MLCGKGNCTHCSFLTAWSPEFQQLICELSLCKARTSYFIFCQVFPQTTCHQNHTNIHQKVRMHVKKDHQLLSGMENWYRFTATAVVHHHKDFSSEMEFPVREPDKYLGETDGTIGIDCMEFSSSMKLSALAAPNNGSLCRCLWNLSCLPSSPVPSRLSFLSLFTKSLVD